jgi:hypothetical protein
MFRPVVPHRPKARLVLRSQAGLSAGGRRGPQVRSLISGAKAIPKADSQHDAGGNSVEDRANGSADDNTDRYRGCLCLHENIPD